MPKGMIFCDNGMSTACLIFQENSSNLKMQINEKVNQDGYQWRADETGI